MGGNTRKPIRGGDNDAQMVGEPIKILHTRLGEFWSVNLERDSCPKVHLYTKKIGIMDDVKEKMIYLCIMIIFQKKTV